MLIANPTFDTFFKYLLDDDRAAKTILEALLGREVRHLTRIRNEVVEISGAIPATQTNAKLLRLDFSAVVRQPDGREEAVSIEMQKAFAPGEAERFRHYIASQYTNPANVIDNKPLHLVAIYILDHNVEGLDEPVTYIEHVYRNKAHEIIDPTPQSEFVESLVHDAIFVQLRRIKVRTGSLLDKVLGIFKVDADKRRDHFVEYDSANAEDDKSVLHIVDVLSNAAGNSELIKKATLENELIRILECYDKAIEDERKMKDRLERMEMMQNVMQKSIAEKENQIAEKENQIAEKENQIAEKENQIAEKENQIAEKENQIAEKENQIAEKENQIAEKDNQIAEKDNQIAEKDNQIAEQNKKMQQMIEKLLAAGIRLPDD